MPLTGRYAAQGVQVRAGLEAWARLTGARLDLADDRSEPGRAAQLWRQLRLRGCDLVLGPYGSDATRAVAAVARGAAVWSHGAAADDVQRLAGVVSLPTPASRYLVALGSVVAREAPGARVFVDAAPGRFPRFAASGLREAAGRLGLALVDEPERAEAILCCGPLEWELERLRRHRRRAPIVGGVSPGLARFPDLLGADPEGLLAPAQWHPHVRHEVDLGPALARLDDYVAAQAYAAALVAARCLELAPDDPLAAARSLRATTFYGPFELAADGLQVGHRLSVVRWTEGAQRLVAVDVA